MKYLQAEHIVEINERIYRSSLVNKEIEYSGKEEYPTDIEKVRKLVKFTPKGSLIDLATYYLKNLILLQAFPNANHRSAILAVALFVKMNGRKLRHPLEDTVEFHKKSFGIHLKVYGSFEARGTAILEEKSNAFTEYCRKFIEKHLAEGD